MRVVRLGFDDLAGQTGALVSWIVDAWKPYRDWLLGGQSRAREVADAWLARATSELSITGVTALVDDDGTHLGGYLAVSGEELPRRRRADLVWLIQHSGEAERRQLAKRLEESRGLFAPVSPGHCYLSKLGVVREHRARGLGGVILDDFIETSFKQGYEAVRTDVWADNDAAVRLYRRRGFESISEAELSANGVRYVAMTLARRDA